jgi:hypothetical protein
MINYTDGDSEELTLYKIKDMFKYVVKENTPVVEYSTSAPTSAPFPAHAAPHESPAPAIDVQINETSVVVSSTPDAAPLSLPAPKEKIVIDLTNVKKSNKVAESLYSLIRGQTKSDTSGASNKNEVSATFMNDGKKMKVIFVEDVETSEV